MTAGPHPRSSDLLAPAPAAIVDAPASDTQPEEATDARQLRRRAWRTWLILVLLITMLYALLWNPYWVPGGDSELYIACARSWARGDGHRFNGQPVSISPPGWPMLLAGAMKLSPSFGFLKLVTLSCMLGCLAMWYW